MGFSNRKYTIERGVSFIKERDIRNKKQVKRMSEWEITKRAIIIRDKRICQACYKRFKVKELTVHHIIPRERDGGDNYENLITLCAPCHDWIEYSGIKTRGEIIACRT